MQLPWKTKGIVLTAPLTDELDDVVKFIDEYLAPRKINLIVMQTRYRYQFKRHPEVWGYDPLSKEDVKKLLAVCRKHGIKLVPKMNLHGHQSGVPNTPTDGILHGRDDVKPHMRDGLLRAYPDFDEHREMSNSPLRCICTKNQAAQMVVCELIDEMMEVFESDTIHIGCDEVFRMAECPVCVHIPKAKLFADWITLLHDHVASRGGKIMMWGDRLLSSKETGYNNVFDASEEGTDEAIHNIPKDIIICDWHYPVYEKYMSVDVFAREGFEMLLSPWWDQEAIDAFLTYAKEHDQGHILGLLATTWCGSGDLAKRLLYGEPGRWEHTDKVALALEKMFNED